MIAAFTLALLPQSVGAAVAPDVTFDCRIAKAGEAPTRFLFVPGSVEPMKNGVLRRLETVDPDGVFGITQDPYELSLEFGPEAKLSGLRIETRGSIFTAKIDPARRTATTTVKRRVWRESWDKNAPIEASYDGSCKVIDGKRAWNAFEELDA